MTYPLVSIIILNWNRKEDTISCLRSIENVSYPNFSVILVDNASSDGTVEAVKGEFPSVKVISNAQNLRFAGGNNVGIEYALQNNSNFVLLLNNDTIVDPNFLSELVKFSDGDKQTGIAGPKIYYYYDQKRIWFAGGKIDYWKGWISHIGIREMDHGQYDSVREVDYITGCCMLVKREVIEKVGKLDEGFFIYGEDSDWCLRASRAGYKLVYIPSAMIWHKVSASSGGNFSWFKNWNKLKSQLKLMARYAKWYHWVVLPILMTIKIIQSSVSASKEN